MSVIAPEKAAKRVGMISLGCPKNLVDAEIMLGQLQGDANVTITNDLDEADVVIVNTCGFIEPARQESLAVIREMLALKKEGKVGAVVVAGCLAERKKEELLKEVPEVDHIVGVFGREEISTVVDRAVVLLRPTSAKSSPIPRARIHSRTRHCRSPGHRRACRCR